MSIQSVRDFFNKHNASATGLAALVAALDAKASGKPLDPALAGRVQDLLTVLGAGDLLNDLSAADATPLVPEIRQHLSFNAKLLYAETRATSWSYGDDRLLEDVGEFARAHAHAIAKMIVPSLEGVAQRFAAPGGAFLDIGVGVGGLAVELAQLFPQLRIVGIDVFQPSLALARARVEKAGLGKRIELREQGAENLEDDKAFDLAWIPVPFIPERVLPAAAERTHRSLRPGGWVIMAYANPEGLDAASVACWRLRLSTWGGPQWSPGEAEKLLRDKGYAEVRTLPKPPGAPVGFAVGRRKPA